MEKKGGKKTGPPGMASAGSLGARWPKLTNRAGGGGGDANRGPLPLAKVAKIGRAFSY